MWVVLILSLVLQLAGASVSGAEARVAQYAPACSAAAASFEAALGEDAISLPGDSETGAETAFSAIIFVPARASWRVPGAPASVDASWRPRDVAIAMSGAPPSLKPPRS